MKIMISVSEKPWVQRIWWWLGFFFKAWVAVMVYLILRAFNFPQGGTP